MTKRAYLSGPITGKENYKEAFRRAQSALLEKGYAVINPAELDGVLNDCFTYEEIMDVCLDLLRQCDYIVQLPGWQESRGCNIEWGYAKGADLIILPLEALL